MSCKNRFSECHRFAADSKRCHRQLYRVYHLTAYYLSCCRSDLTIGSSNTRTTRHLWLLLYLGGLGVARHLHSLHVRSLGSCDRDGFCVRPADHADCGSGHHRTQEGVPAKGPTRAPPVRPEKRASTSRSWGLSRTASTIRASSQCCCKATI